MNQIDIGELSVVRETLCNGIDEECKFNGKYWVLLQAIV